MTTPTAAPSLTAGCHPVPLDQVHADMGTEGLYLHLADPDAHSHPLDRRTGADVAQHTHRAMREEGTK